MKSFCLAAVPLLLLFTGGTAEALVYEDEVLADSPLGYWQFEETIGSAVDSSGNLRDGTYMLGVTPGVSAGVPSIGGMAAEFDGTTGYVNLPGAWGGELVTEVTLEAWVNTAEPITDDFQSIMGGHDPNAFAHFSLHSGGNSGVYTDVGFLGLPITPATPTGVWRHVVMTAKSGESMIYVDGVQLGATSTAEFSYVTESSNVDIGRGHLSTRWFNGLLDEVAIYETALSPERIMAHFEAGLGISTLTWDNVGPNTWRSDHWTGGEKPFPDETVRTIVNDANTHIITVAEIEAAYNLTVDAGGIAINDDQSLSVVMDATFAPGSTLSLGNNAMLAADGGSIDAVTADGNATIHVGTGAMPVASLTLTGSGTFAKQGDGTLILDNTDGSSVTAGENSVFKIEGGTLRSAGTHPLGDSTQAILAGGTLVVRGAAGTPGAPPEGPAAHWTFDVDASDETGTHGGTLEGGAGITAEAKIGAGALDLRGVDGYVDILSTVLDAEESCSVAYYVNADSLAPLNAIFANDTWVGGGMHVNIVAEGLPELAISGSYPPYAHPTSPVPTDGSWVHVAFAYDSATATTKCYFNGAEETVVLHAAGPLVGVGPATIGAWDTTGGDTQQRFVDGRIDDLIIYDRALTGAEVATMYGLTAPDMSTTDLTVTGDSTLSVTSPTDVSFRELTLVAGTLTATGASVSFTGTTIDEDATAVGVNMQMPVVLNVINVNATDPVTFSKSGPVDLVMTSANVGSGFDKLTFNVQEGKLIGVHGSNPFGTAGLQVAGGELVLSSAGGSVLYDNPLSVTESGMVTAGAAGGGVDDELTVTLGSSPGHGVSIDPGKTLSLRSTGDYALTIAGPIDGPEGVISAAEGSLGLAGGGEVGSVRAAGGTLSTAGTDLAVQNIDVSAGVLVDTGESQVVIGNRMRLDKVSFVIDAEHTFAVSSSDLLAGGEVTLSDGTLDIGVPGPPSGAIAYWKFNEGPGSTIAVNSANPGTYDGMVTGATFVPDDPQRGRVLNFDGTGDYVDVPEMGDYWEEISYSLWLNINAVPDNLDAIIDGEWAAGGLHWSLRNEPRVMGVDINAENMGIAGNSTFGADQIGQWHHLVLTYKSGEELVFYVDGVEDSTHAVLARTILMGPRQIGAWNGTREMNAMYDDVFVYDRVLGPEEVETLYGILGEEVLIDLPNTNFTVTGDQCTLQLDTYEDATLGNLTLEGSAALTVAGAPANVRDIVAGDGSKITGNLVVRGTIYPGSSAGTLTIDSKGFFEMDLEDARYAADLHGETNDLVIIQNGDADLGGTLTVTGTLPLQAAGGSSVWGDVRRVVVEVGELGGENYCYGKFDPVVSGTSYVSTPPDPDYLGSGMWLGGVGYYDYVVGQYVEVDPAQDDPYQSVQVTVFQAKAGDCNGDRSISFADFNDLANNYTGALATGTGGKDWRQGDFNGDADVDFGDFNDLANNYTGAGVEYGPLAPAGDAKSAPEGGVPGDAKLIVYLANTTGEDGMFHAAGDVVLSVEAGLAGLAKGDAPGMRINGYEVYSAGGSLIADPSGMPYPLMGGAYMEESAAGIVAFGGLASPLVVSGHQEFTLRWKYNAAAESGQDLEFLYGTSEGVVSGDVLYVVPEPGTLTLLLLAGGALALLLRRRRNETEVGR